MCACVHVFVCESAVICHLGSPQEGENILLPLMIADSCQREEREDSRRKTRRGGGESQRGRQRQREKGKKMQRGGGAMQKVIYEV